MAARKAKKGAKPAPAKKAAPPTAKAPEKPQLEGLSQEEIARLVGCAQSTVSRAIARGDIATLTNGRVPESEAEKLIELRKRDERVASETAEMERRLLAAQTGEREAKAKLRQLELERESGRFVELELVRRAGADPAERVLAVLRAIPQRTAMALECPCARAAVVEKKISDEVERAIAELRESLYLLPPLTPAPRSE
jgi:predicted transcriptional regulator